MTELTPVKALCGSCKIYVRRPTPSVMLHANYAGNKTYFELQTIQKDNGIVQELVEVDYPITPSYVKSFVEDTDYKKNPELLTRNAGKQNLGDVTSIQELTSKDMSAMREQAQALADKLSKLESEKLAQESAIPAGSQESKSEVTNNEKI